MSATPTKRHARFPENLYRIFLFFLMGRYQYRASERSNWGKLSGFAFQAPLTFEPSRGIHSVPILFLTEPRRCNALMLYWLGSLGLSRWLKNAPVLIHPYIDLWNFALEDVQFFTTNTMAPDLAAEMPESLPQRASSQPQPFEPVSCVPEASTCETYLISASPSLAGSIDQPSGRPIFTGGYSDVWQCNIRFSLPSGILPTQVLRSVWLSNQNEADANERKLRRFRKEVITWLSLPNHPNIVPLVGWTLTPNLSFISPWYKQGNLYSSPRDTFRGV